MAVCYNDDSQMAKESYKTQPNENSGGAAPEFSVLSVIAQYSVQPLADIICCYTCYDGNQKGIVQSHSPLSVARLGFGDNTYTVSQRLYTYQ